MSVVLQLLGVETVKGNLDRKAKRVPRAIRNAVRRCGTLMTKAIKANLKRKRLGILAKSIGNKTIEVSGNKARATALAGARRGFGITLQSIQHRLKGGVLGSVVRDKTSGKVEYEVVAERKKTGKSLKLRTTAEIFTSVTKGKRKGQNIVVDPVRYAHLVQGGHKRGKGRSAAKAYSFMPEASRDSAPGCKAEVREAMVSEILKG